MVQRAGLTTEGFMGNPIEDAMSDWHERFGVPATKSDKQFYKNLVEKYELARYAKPTHHNFSAKFPRDEELKESGQQAIKETTART